MNPSPNIIPDGSKKFFTTTYSFGFDEVRIRELDHGIRSDDCSVRTANILKFSSIMENYPFPYVINHCLIRLSEFYRSVKNDNHDRLNVLNVFLSIEDKISSDTCYSSDQIVERIFQVYGMIDSIARSITLRILGTLTNVLTPKVEFELEKQFFKLHTFELFERQSLIFLVGKICLKNMGFGTRVYPTIKQLLRSNKIQSEDKTHLIEMCSMIFCPKTRNYSREDSSDMLNNINDDFTSFKDESYENIFPKSKPPINMKLKESGNGIVFDSLLFLIDIFTDLDSHRHSEAILFSIYKIARQKFEILEDVLLLFHDIILNDRRIDVKILALTFFRQLLQHYEVESIIDIFLVSDSDEHIIQKDFVCINLYRRSTSNEKIKKIDFFQLLKSKLVFSNENIVKFDDVNPKSEHLKKYYHYKIELFRIIYLLSENDNIARKRAKEFEGVVLEYLFSKNFFISFYTLNILRILVEKQSEHYKSKVFTFKYFYFSLTKLLKRIFRSHKNKSFISNKKSYLNRLFDMLVSIKDNDYTNLVIEKVFLGFIETVDFNRIILVQKNNLDYFVNQVLTLKPLSFCNSFIMSYIVQFLYKKLLHQGNELSKSNLYALYKHFMGNFEVVVKSSKHYIDRCKIETPDAAKSKIPSFFIMREKTLITFIKMLILINNELFDRENIKQQDLQIVDSLIMYKYSWVAYKIMIFALKNNLFYLSERIGSFLLKSNKNSKNFLWIQILYNLCILDTKVFANSIILISKTLQNMKLLSFVPKSLNNRRCRFNVEFLECLNKSFEFYSTFKNYRMIHKGLIKVIRKKFKKLKFSNFNIDEDSFETIKFIEYKFKLISVALKEGMKSKKLHRLVSNRSKENSITRFNEKLQHSIFTMKNVDSLINFMFFEDHGKLFILPKCFFAFKSDVNIEFYVKINEMKIDFHKKRVIPQFSCCRTDNLVIDIEGYLTNVLSKRKIKKLIIILSYLDFKVQITTKIIVNTDNHLFRIVYSLNFGEKIKKDHFMDINSKKFFKHIESKLKITARLVDEDFNEWRTSFLKLISIRLSMKTPHMN